MRALQFQNNMNRVALTYLLGQISRSAFVGPWAPVKLTDVPEPNLPATDWVRIETQLAGICGSDSKQVHLNGARDNPLTALISFPHVLGHEAVGRIVETGPDVKCRRLGERVVLNPWLSCTPRGISPVCSACADGDYMLCRNFLEGRLPPGIHLGNNAVAPGVFCERFVAHESQCFPIPDAISNEAAVLADPFSVSLHSILRWPPAGEDPVFVYGLGALGLLAISALKVLYPQNPIYAVGKYPRQVELALLFGATEVLSGNQNDIIERVATLTGARVYRPWSKVPWLLDGVGVVYDTVGTPATIETAIRLVKSRGSVVVSGVEMPKRFEWTPIYFKELSLVGSNAFGIETFRGRRVHAIEAYLKMVADGLDVTPVITHRFGLAQWRDAFQAVGNRAKSGAVKTIFDSI